MGFFDDVADVFNDVVDTGGGIIGDIIDIGGDIIGGGADIIGGGIGDIIDFGSGALEDIIDAGGDIFDALPDSIKSIPGQVGDWVVEEIKNNGGDIAAALIAASGVFGSSDDPSEISSGNKLDASLLAQTTSLQPGPAAATAFLADQFGLGRAPGSEGITFPEDFTRFLTEPRIDPSIAEASQGIIDDIPGLLDESIEGIQGLAPIVQDLVETGGLHEEDALRILNREVIPGLAERFPSLGFGSGAQALTTQAGRDIITDFSLARPQNQLQALGIAPGVFSLPSILSTEVGSGLQNLGEGQAVLNRLGSEGGSLFTTLGQLNAISSGLGIPFQQEIPNISGGTGGILADLAGPGAQVLGPAIQRLIDKLGS